MFMKMPDYDIDASLGHHAAMASRLMTRRLNRGFLEAGLDISVEQWSVLLWLWETPALSQEEAAALLCVEKSSLSRVLDVLERKGLIRRERDPEDARRKRLLATRKAGSLRAATIGQATETLARATRGIEPEDVDACLRVLRRVRRNIQEDLP